MKDLVNNIGIAQKPRKVEFIKKEVKEPRDREVLIKIVASGICGSDLHLFRGNHPSVPLPAAIGHELSGDVVAIGEKVRDIEIGDRVTIEPVLTCGECMACRTGNYGHCENISFTYREGDGAMANYITALEERVFKLPKNMSYEEGTLIEPLSVATHAVRRADVKLGEKVLVIGGGVIGLLVSSLSKLAGASQVIVVDSNDYRLDLALEMGGTHVVNRKKEDALDIVNELTKGVGIDKAFECVGKEAAFVQAMNSLKKDGLATILGIFEEPDITIPAPRFITREIKVQGSQGYCWDFQIALSIAESIPLKKLITHKFPLDELQEALETCLDRSKKSVKVIVEQRKYT